jgi:hypothetical protein
VTDSSVRTEPVTTTVTSEAEAIFYTTRHAQAYADLNQGSWYQRARHWIPARCAGRGDQAAPAPAPQSGQ